jgi:anhydro-N-acetylmuramic acid kinase
MAAGGQGAPLVPWIDQVLFAADGTAAGAAEHRRDRQRDWVPARGAAEPVFAFDTGPGNALIDAAVEIATGGRQTYDRDGALAAQGTVDEALLEELLGHPYFAMEPPKSSGREEFGRPFVERLVDAVRRRATRDWLDLVATLTELTARSIADAYERWILPRGVARW